MSNSTTIENNLALFCDFENVALGVRDERFPKFDMQLVQIIAALTDPSSIRRCLQGMRLPARAPPIAPARPDPQPQLDYA
jgi:hypothetical protein